MRSTMYFDSTERPKTTIGPGKYYGGGEAFLFKLVPEPRVYPWSGKNRLFTCSDERSIMIGGGAGVAGLWLDSDFENGSSDTCLTFENESLSSTVDFKVDGVEVWGLTPSEEF